MSWQATCSPKARNSGYRVDSGEIFLRSQRNLHAPTNAVRLETSYRRTSRCIISHKSEVESV